MQSFPEFGFVRLDQIIGRRGITREQADANRDAGRRGRRPRPQVNGIIPMSAAKWWRHVKNGRFPQPVKQGTSTLWRVEDVRALVQQIGAAGRGGGE